MRRARGTPRTSSSSLTRRAYRSLPASMLGRMSDAGMPALSVRLPGAPRDAEAVAAIYAPVVRDTVISFEEVPPDANEMRRRMERVLDWAPWLVAEADG